MTRPATREPYDWSLLKYAEAVRTGKRLGLARGLRAKLLRTNPFSIAALDEVMPYKPHDRKRHKRNRKTKRQRRDAFVARQVKPRDSKRPDRAPTFAQRGEIERLSSELGREPWIPTTGRAASAEITRLQQVRANTRKT